MEIDAAGGSHRQARRGCRLWPSRCARETLGEDPLELLSVFLIFVRFLVARSTLVVELCHGIYGAGHGGQVSGVTMEKMALGHLIICGRLRLKG